MTRGSHSSLVACLCELSPLFPLRLWKGQRPQPWAGDHPLVLSWQGPWGWSRRCLSLGLGGGCLGQETFPGPATQ